MTTTSSTTGMSCHGARQGKGRWFQSRRVLLAAGAAIVAAGALALNQQWLSARELLPLLYLAPCAAMTVMCMKGHRSMERAEAVNRRNPSTTAGT